MAEGTHGGHRTPAQPAATSGPGALSQRTDGNATQAGMVASGGAYGERAEMESIQSGAPMAASPTPAQAQTPHIDPSQLPRLDEPTARPYEDVTSGVGSVPDYGDTEMSEAVRDRARRALPTLLWLASRPNASEQTRQIVRQFRADA